jgi:hypothetical protein
MGLRVNRSGSFCQPTADEFVGGKAAESLKSFGEVIGGDEVAEMNAQLVIAVVVVALNRGLFDGAVHALDLAVGPGMVRFGKSVVDAEPKTDPVEGMAAKAGGWSLSILWKISELDAVVGEHGMNAIRNCSDQRFEESRSSLHVSTHESELRSAVDSHEEVELAFRGTHFGQIDMKKPIG